jgi:hypothetical protein
MGQIRHSGHRSLQRVRYASIFSARIGALKGHEAAQGGVQECSEDALARHTRRQALLASAAAASLSMLSSSGPALADAIDTTITSQVRITSSTTHVELRNLMLQHDVQLHQPDMTFAARWCAGLM